MPLKPIVMASALMLAGCAHFGAAGPTAVAKLEPTKGNTASGSVTFTQVGDKVRVEATLAGLKPGADHGFHIHDKGDCSSGDGMSTGGHFNPLGKPHGHHGGPERHAGDLPAVKADASGNAKISVMMDVISVSPGPTSVVGRGMILHRDPDDYKTQPTGNAGPRIACAVIQAG
ncbi:MAG: superoxide dismutase family protein [Betaproteobacteria bacterium]